MNEHGPPRDHVQDEDTGTTGTQHPGIEENLKSKSTWTRAFFMLVVFILWSVSRIVLAAVVIVQLGQVLLTGSKNQSLLQLGQSLARYSYEIVAYLTFNSDLRPFPFDLGWPVAETSAESHAEAESPRSEPSA